MGDERVGAVVFGPWLAGMTEAEFLTFILERLSAEPAEVRMISLVDLQLDIQLPPDVVQPRG